MEYAVAKKMGRAMPEDKHQTLNKLSADQNLSSSKQSPQRESEEIFRRMFEDNNVAMLLYEPTH